MLIIPASTILLIILVGVVIYSLVGLAMYTEAVIYNSHRLDSIVPSNRIQVSILRLYSTRPRFIDGLLTVMSLTSVGILVSVGFVLAEIRGVSLGIVLGWLFLEHYKDGLHLSTRIEKRLSRDAAIRARAHEKDPLPYYKHIIRALIRRSKTPTLHFRRYIERLLGPDGPPRDIVEKVLNIYATEESEIGREARELLAQHFETHKDL